MTGTYIEQLGSGKLNVGARGWSIEYYWPGPDARYRGTFFNIDGKEIVGYIRAWEDNFLSYVALTRTVPHGGQFEKPGDKGMTIRVGGNWPGVSLRSYHFQVKTREQVEKVVADYRYAEARANSIRIALFS